MALLFKSDPAKAERWRTLFAQHAPDIEFRQWPDIGNAEEIDYLLAWLPPDDLPQCLPALKVLFAVSAGVDQFDMTQLPSEVPLVRMLDPSIEAGMVEYANFATLWLYRGIHTYTRQQQSALWKPHAILPANQCRVGILGLGELGTAIAISLQSLGFSLHGWARSPRVIEGVTCFAGEDQLGEFLDNTDILICVLPLTDSTRHILNHSLFSQLPKGAALVNMGRGEHLDQDDLIESLDNGHLSAAVLDVATPEPLPQDHPFWHHPNILLTPHIAATTQPETAFPILLENIRKFERDEPMEGLVDKQKGY